MVAAYLLLNAAYSYGLKHAIGLDVIAIAIGFVLRAVAGGVAIGVEISPWLIACTFMGALFLGLAKRRAELFAAEDAVGARPSMRGYTAPLLDQMITIAVAATIVSYVIYTLSDRVRETLEVQYMHVTVPFVVYGLFRYLYLVRRGDRAQDPARLLATDPPLVATVLLWAGAAFALLYLG
jgi:4-hydroxybenzoate polyprenyltransferase